MKKTLLLTGFLLSCYAFGNEVNQNDFRNTEVLKNEIIQSKNFQKFLVEEWYWFTLCGNTIAFITHSEAEAFTQAYEYYMTSSNCAKQRGEFFSSYV